MNEYIINYKSLTDSMIATLQAEDYDKFTELLNERQLIIEHIEKEGIKISDYVQAEEKNQMLLKEKQLNELLEFQKYEVKKKIQQLKKCAKVGSSYNKSFYTDNKLFSKKI